MLAYSINLPFALSGSEDKCIYIYCVQMVKVALIVTYISSHEFCHTVYYGSLHIYQQSYEAIKITM